VIPARILFQKSTGGVIEIFCLEPYEAVNEYSSIMAKKEKVKWVKNNFYSALIMLGDETYLKTLMKGLDSRLYRNRCSVVNLLSDLLNENNKAEIESALTQRLNVEASLAVRSGIEKAIKDIESKKYEAVL